MLNLLGRDLFGKIESVDLPWIVGPLLKIFFTFQKLLSGTGSLELTKIHTPKSVIVLPLASQKLSYLELCF